MAPGLTGPSHRRRFTARRGASGALLPRHFPSALRWASPFPPLHALLSSPRPARLNFSRSLLRRAQAVAAPQAPQKDPAAYIPANLHGFKVLRSEYIAEYDAVAILYKHAKTGAEARSPNLQHSGHPAPLGAAPDAPPPARGPQLMSVSCDDENKTFGVVLRTPPANSTGIPHILEHSVLCGSRKYPIKEPFVELMKGSLNTFLNAFTYPDRTCYPVASCNLQDFYNLVDVYLDAVYFPNCVRDERTFQQARTGAGRRIQMQMQIPRRCAPAGRLALRAQRGGGGHHAQGRGLQRDEGRLQLARQRAGPRGAAGAVPGQHVRRGQRRRSGRHPGAQVRGVPGAP